MLRSLLIPLFSILIFGLTYSQTTIQGTIVDYITGEPVPGIKVSSLLQDMALTDEDGRFSIQHSQGKTLYLLIERGNEVLEWKTDQVVSDGMDLGKIEFRPTNVNASQPDIPTITIQEEDAEDQTSISGLLQSGNNLFGQITDYTFSSARFRRRGLGNEYYEGYLNQVPVNDLASGGVFFSNWPMWSKSKTHPYRRSK